MKTHQKTISKITRPRWASVGAALALMVTGIAADAQTIPGVNVYPAVPGLAPFARIAEHRVYTENRKFI